MPILVCRTTVPASEGRLRLNHRSEACGSKIRKSLLIESNLFAEIFKPTVTSKKLQVQQWTHFGINYEPYLCRVVERLSLF